MISRGLLLALIVALQPQQPVVAPADLAVAPTRPAQPWPSFRGTNASGVGDGQGAVVEWNLDTGKNVRWTTPIPGVANSSPIVWGNHIYLTTAVSSTGDNTFQAGNAGIQAHADLSEHTWKLYALNAADGSIDWERDVHRGIPRTKRHPKGSQAASTPVTDGQRVVVFFGTTGILATYDTRGELVWKKDLGVIDTGYVQDPGQQWGQSSSPILYEDSIILQVDQQKNSYIAAFDLATGAERWKASRDDEISTWGTPTVVRGTAGDELITNGTKIRGYDPKTGGLLWTLAPNSQVVIPTPIAGPDLVYVTGGYQPARPIYAIRPGARGDISLASGTSSNNSIAWSSDREGVYIPTPVLYRNILYTLNNNGVLTAYNAESGERIYRSRVGTGGAFSASPIAADGRLYFSNEDGQVFVVRAGTDYVQIAVNEMGDPITATPAVSGGLLIIRTIQTVYGIGAR